MSEPTLFNIKTRKPHVVHQGDEDFLTQEDKAEKKTAERGGEGGDCSTRKRACKNCVCGRAELEKKMDAEGNQITNTSDGMINNGPPPGGCGGCSRGDAFRCAGCPFLGQKAWNTTETGKVQLTLTDDI